MNNRGNPTGGWGRGGGNPYTNRSRGGFAYNIDDIRPAATPAFTRTSNEAASVSNIVPAAKPNPFADALESANNGLRLARPQSIGAVYVNERPEVGLQSRPVNLPRADLPNGTSSASAAKPPQPAKNDPNIIVVRGEVIDLSDLLEDVDEPPAALLEKAASQAAPMRLEEKREKPVAVAPRPSWSVPEAARARPAEESASDPIDTIPDAIKSQLMEKDGRISILKGKLDEKLSELANLRQQMLSAARSQPAPVSMNHHEVSDLKKHIEALRTAQAHKERELEEAEKCIQDLRRELEELRGRGQPTATPGRSTPARSTPTSAKRSVQVSPVSKPDFSPKRPRADAAVGTSPIKVQSQRAPVPHEEQMVLPQGATTVERIRDPLVIFDPEIGLLELLNGIELKQDFEPHIEQLIAVSAQFGDASIDLARSVMDTWELQANAPGALQDQGLLHLLRKAVNKMLEDSSYVPAVVMILSCLFSFGKFATAMAAASCLSFIFTADEEQCRAIIRTHPRIKEEIESIPDVRLPGMYSDPENPRIFRRKPTGEDAANGVARPANFPRASNPIRLSPQKQSPLKRQARSGTRVEHCLDWLMLLTDSRGNGRFLLHRQLELLALLAENVSDSNRYALFSRFFLDDGLTKLVAACKEHNDLCLEALTFLRVLVRDSTIWSRVWLDTDDELVHWIYDLLMHDARSMPGFDVQHLDPRDPEETAAYCRLRMVDLHQLASEFLMSVVMSVPESLEHLLKLRTKSREKTREPKGLVEILVAVVRRVAEDYRFDANPEAMKPAASKLLRSVFVLLGRLVTESKEALSELKIQGLVLLSVILDVQEKRFDEDPVLLRAAHNLEERLFSDEAGQDSSLGAGDFSQSLA